MTDEPMEEGRYDDFIRSCDEAIARMDKEILTWFDASPRFGRVAAIIFHPDIREWYGEKRQKGEIASWWAKSLKK